MPNQLTPTRRSRSAGPRLRFRSPGLGIVVRQEQLLIGLTALLFLYILLHFIMPLIGRPGLY
jgi:hypothetical protein